MHKPSTYLQGNYQISYLFNYIFGPFLFFSNFSFPNFDLVVLPKSLAKVVENILKNPNFPKKLGG